MVKQHLSNSTLDDGFPIFLRGLWQVMGIRPTFGVFLYGPFLQFWCAAAPCVVNSVGDFVEKTSVASCNVVLCDVRSVCYITLACHVAGAAFCDMVLYLLFYLRKVYLAGQCFVMPFCVGAWPCNHAFS